MNVIGSPARGSYRYECRTLFFYLDEKGEAVPLETDSEGRLIAEKLPEGVALEDVKYCDVIEARYDRVERKMVPTKVEAGRVK